MFELAKWGALLVSPLVVVMGLGLLAVLSLALRRRALSVALASTAFGLLWVASTPMVAQALTGALESKYPALTVDAAPPVDAILVLGGALVGANPPRRPTFTLGPAAGRVWEAAALYRAGKAKWVVVAAGNQPHESAQQIESEAISEMLQVLGVPKSAIRLESTSRNTRENAINVLRHIQELKAKRIVLVTSAQHMPRAIQTFSKVWANTNIELLPFPVDPRAVRANSPFSWIPTPESLVVVTRALKEFAGSVALAII